MNKEQRNQYIRAYNQKHTKRISLNLSKSKDLDILQAVEKESNGNIQAGIKSLIRKGILYKKFNPYT